MKQGKAGTEKNSDLLVTVEATDKELDLQIESSVMTMFGRQIEAQVRKVLEDLKVERGTVVMKDNGAVDMVIAARLESALRRAGMVSPGSVKVPSRAPTPKDRLRRTRLYLPGNKPDLMLNSGLFGADSYILDLEDSVSPDQKPDARVLIRKFLEEGETFFPDSEIIVRINPLASPFGKEDLAEMVPGRPHILLLPKCDSSEDIRQAEALVSEIEKTHGITEKVHFMPLIETVKGVVNAASIATASDRNVALCFGAEDFTRDLGVKRTREGKETLHARSQVVLAAVAAGIQAIDTVFSDVGDEEGLRASCVEAKSLGFCGKGVIHPRQIRVVHEAFAPSAADVAYACKVIDALRKAEAAGSGVVSLGSKMVDAPVAERARKLVDMAKRLGMPGLETY